MWSHEQERAYQWRHSGAGIIMRQFHELKSEKGTIAALSEVENGLDTNTEMIPPIKIALMDRLIVKESSDIHPTDPLAKYILVFRARNADRKIRYDHFRRHNARHCRRAPRFHT